jgi:transcriptional regulator with XRE-family HTH domain
MDDAPQTDDLELAAVTTRDGLLALLQTVYLRADRPSLRVLEARTRHGAVPLSKTVASELLRGERFPRKAVMLAFLQACGLQDNQLEPWRRTWERITVLEAEAARTPQPPGNDRSTGLVGRSVPGMAAGPDPAGDEVRRLRVENQELRQQLAMSGSGAAGQSYRDDESLDAEAGNPVISRRELGASLRALRLERGMTVEQVAGYLLCSVGKVSRMESGFRSGTLRDVRDLCNLYDLPEGTQRDRLMDLARESKRQGWWQAHAQGLSHFETFLGLENGAASIREYQSGVVPGLLQTEGYARGLFQADGPFPLPPALPRELIKLRLARQRMLTRPDPPDCSMIIDEAALRRPIGGPEVMRGQLSHLIEASRLPNVTVQVIPFAVGAHSALGNVFTILEFPGQAPGVVYVEGLFGWLYLEREAELKRYRQVFEILAKLALGEEDSRSSLVAMMSEIG